MQYWNDIWAIFREGLDHMKPIQGLVIGLVFALTVQSIGSLFIVPAMAAIVYLAADAVIPSLLGHKDIVVPSFDAAFWHHFLSLYSVFFVAAVIVFVVRTLLAGLRS